MQMFVFELNTKTKSRNLAFGQLHKQIVVQLNKVCLLEKQICDFAHSQREIKKTARLNNESELSWRHLRLS